MEGDFIETWDGGIYDVKGYVHPPGKVVAFIKYAPSRRAERFKNGVGYERIYALESRLSYLQRFKPQYLIFDEVFGRVMVEVPLSDVKEHYLPEAKLQALRRREFLDRVEADALDLIRKVKETSGVSWFDMGVSGSILLDMHNDLSDVDLVIYGKENCLKAYEALLAMRERGLTRAYQGRLLEKLHEVRSMENPTAFELFKALEGGKVLEGTYGKREYFVRMLKRPEECGETYGDRRYRRIEEAHVQGVVVDDGESIFTPCRYVVELEKPARGAKQIAITSFRGRFTELARVGEAVEAHGVLEEVLSRQGVYYQLLLDAKGGFLKSTSLT